MFFEVEYGRPQWVKTSLLMNTLTIDVPNPCEKVLGA